MTGRELFQEIGNIREEYITEAENFRKVNSSIMAILNRKVAGNASFVRTLSAAACLVICAGLVFTVQKLGVSQDAATESVRDFENAVEEMAVAESSVAQNTASGQEKKAEIQEARPETEASMVPEVAEEAKKESGKEEGYLSDIHNDRVEEALKSEPVWDLKSIRKKMASYPDKYEEILKLEGVFILVHGEVEKGQEIWDAFVQSVDLGEAASAEIIRFTVEGDPIIEHVYYDGKEFYLCVDNSRDAFRGKGDAYYEANYSSLVKEETILDGGGKSIEYCLIDGEKEYSIVYFVE